MGFRIDVREVGPNDKVPTTGWPTGQPAAAPHPEPQPALVQLMTDIGGKLMHWAKGGTPPAKPASEPQPSAEPGVTDSQEAILEPSRVHRAAPAVRDENNSPEAMIKPSRCHRAAIEAHRDDWP